MDGESEGSETRAAIPRYTQHCYHSDTPRVHTSDGCVGVCMYVCTYMKYVCYDQYIVWTCVVCEVYFELSGTGFVVRVLFV